VVSVRENLESEIAVRIGFDEIVSRGVDAAFVDDELGPVFETL
jgi:hypothetical protein